MSEVTEAIRARLQVLDEQIEGLDRERVILRRTLAELSHDAPPALPTNLTPMPDGLTDRRQASAKPKPNRTRPGSNAERILSYIGSNPRARVPQIAAVTGVQKDTVYSTMVRLEKAGRVVKVDLGERQVGYVLPEPKEAE